jgi:hypothetical protein
VRARSEPGAAFATLAAGVVIELRSDCSPQAFLGVILGAKTEAPMVEHVAARGRQRALRSFNKTRDPPNK